mgnify:CR=1 FL=1
MKKKFFALMMAMVMVLSLAACGGSADDSGAADDGAATEAGSDAAETVTLTVAASPTPHAEILNQCVPILAEQGIELVVNEYSDYVVPNTAVEDGDEDANYFQHLPYLEEFNETRGTHLVSVAGVHIEPMGIYAGRVSSLEDLPDGQTRVVVTPWKCSECGVCVAACSNSGIDGMKLRQLTTLGPVSVYKCSKTLCADCGKPIAPNSSEGICSVCRIKRRTKQRQEEAAARARERIAEREAPAAAAATAVSVAETASAPEKD